MQHLVLIIDSILVTLNLRIGESMNQIRKETEKKAATKEKEKGNRE